MTYDPVMAGVRQLLDERKRLVLRIEEIDAKAAHAMRLLGPTPSSPRKGDGRRVGTMVDLALQTIGAYPEGITRAELKSLIGAHPRFGPQLARNENAFYALIGRGRRKGEIVDVGGRLYAPAHAPGG